MHLLPNEAADSIRCLQMLCGIEQSRLRPHTSHRSVDEQSDKVTPKYMTAAWSSHRFIG